MPPVAALKRAVFPVRFHRSQFVHAVKRHQPEVVLRLGQSTRRTIEFATRTAKRRRAGKKAKARAIRRRGPRWLPTTLDSKLGPHVKRSNNAGRYVCNLSMHVILDQIQRAEAITQCGFIRTPQDLALYKAAGAVAGALKNLGFQTGTFVGTMSTVGSKAGAPSPT